MQCQENLVRYLSWGFILGGLAFFLKQTRSHTRYGRYAAVHSRLPTCPAKVAWFFQELPSFLVPVLLLWSDDGAPGLGRSLLLWTFCLHYFQRTFIYSLLTKGCPCPLHVVVSAVVFCSVNGFLQGHHLLHCARYDQAWLTDPRLGIGLLFFFLGMAINIHSDHVLRNLRLPGEIVYRIPRGGMFEYVSGANFFGEILEWSGFAIATWSLPAFAFSFFTMCAIGPRAYHHHRFYVEKFADYPPSRKAVIPFVF